MSTPYFKACPNCRRQCPLTQDFCEGCGHVFRTRFTPDGRPEGDKTLVVSPGSLVAVPGEQAPIYCTRCRARIDLSIIHCPTCGWDQRQYAQNAPPPAPAPTPQPPVYQQRVPTPPQHQVYYPPQSSGYIPPSGYAPPQYPQQQYQCAPLQTAPRADIIQYAPGSFSTSGPIVAAIFITGVGQMCNRQVGKGVVLLLSALFISVPTAGIGALVVWLIALIDAIQIAGRLNRGEAIRPWQWF